MRRGALLLEALIALAIFVMAGLAILSVLRQSVGNLRAARDRALAADLARSALAQIESGIATPESLDGPAREWSGASSAIAFEDAPPPQSPWSLDIKIEEAGIGGLSRIRVRVSRDQRFISELQQLIPLVRTSTTNAGGS